nr:reverse transcriptase domain-containing protein [Tanacetum cinerariifolium]
MIDNRTMAEMLCAPTEGCTEAIVVPPILAEQFELKHSLINMMTSEQFFGLEKDNPHDHVRWDYLLRNMKEFVAIGSEEDERMIRDMNKKAEDESNDKGVDNTKMIKKRSRMKRMSKSQKIDVDLKEEEKLKKNLKIDPDEEGFIDYDFLDKTFPIINCESKVYHYDRLGAEEVYYRIFRSDGSSRWIKTFLKW